MKKLSLVRGAGAFVLSAVMTSSGFSAHLDSEIATNLIQFHPTSNRLFVQEVNDSYSPKGIEISNNRDLIFARVVDIEAPETVEDGIKLNTMVLCSKKDSTELIVDGKHIRSIDRRRVLATFGQSDEPITR